MELFVKIVIFAKKDKYLLGIRPWIFKTFWKYTQGQKLQLHDNVKYSFKVNLEHIFNIILVFLSRSFFLPGQTILQRIHFY